MGNRSDSGPKALSVSQNSGCGGCFGWSFALVFLAAGLAMTWFLTLRPLWGIYEAQSWVATPCEIVSSGLNHNGEGSTKLEVVYTYTFDGASYRSEQYCFVSASTNTSTAWKNQVVADLPAGKASTCFVDPKKPSVAVIDRGWVPDMWWCLFPLPFVLVGGLFFLAMIGVIRTAPTNPAGTWRPQTSTSIESNVDDERDDDAYESPYRPNIDKNDGPVTLKPEATPLQMMIGSLFLALFVNGILLFFAWDPIQQFRGGGFGVLSWFTALFMIPFVAVGLGLIGFVIYCFLSLFNPVPTLVVSSAAIPLGEELRVNWTLSGRVYSIREFRITLKGTEKATYRRGTNTVTDKSVFALIPIFETTQSFDMEEGSATVTIPADSMHSFSSANNKIEWTLEVRGEIALWPDVAAAFPITVLPQTKGSA